MHPRHRRVHFYCNICWMVKELHTKRCGWMVCRRWFIRLLLPLETEAGKWLEENQFLQMSIFGNSAQPAF